MKKPILICGEAFGEHEERKGQAFVGPSGGLLNSFLSANGISRSDCYITNVFNFRPPGNKLYSLCGPKSEAVKGLPSIAAGKYISRKYQPELDRLYDEIRSINPNLIIALGGTATWATLRDPRIKKLRGAPAVGCTGHKVLPTYHPAAVLREYKLRPIVFADFKKAARESAFPDVRRPDRTFLLHPTLNDLAEFERQHILPAEILSVDIETWSRQITCIGFATSPSSALVIPFVWHGTKDGNYWRNIEDELKAWAYVHRWLNLGKKIIGQNFLYDARYLWDRYGIPINQIAGDTMLIHHAQQPEMEKSLGFLGSIHTSEPSWKFMRTDINTLKKED
jgi:uracil-DNA glycosylase